MSYALYSIYLCLPFYAYRLNILFSKNLILCVFFYPSFHKHCMHHALCNHLCFLYSVSHSCSMALVYFYKNSFYSFNLIFLILCSSHHMHFIIFVPTNASVHLYILLYRSHSLYFNLYFSSYAFYCGLKI